MLWLTQTLADVPAETTWLHANERDTLDRLRFAKRRSDWRLGRWTAKNAVRALWAESNPESPALTLAEIEIFASADGRPAMRVAGRAAGIEISISHSHGLGFAVATASRQHIGCDVERIDPGILTFIEDYLAAEEWSLVQSQAAWRRPAVATLLWSAKESMLKALGDGLRRDTRSLVVTLGKEERGNNWSSFSSFVDGRSRFQGSWRMSGNQVFTVIPTDTIDLLIPVPRQCPPAPSLVWGTALTAR